MNSVPSSGPARGTETDTALAANVVASIGRTPTLARPATSSRCCMPARAPKDVSSSITAAGTPTHCRCPSLRRMPPVRTAWLRQRPPALRWRPQRPRHAPCAAGAWHEDAGPTRGTAAVRLEHAPGGPACDSADGPGGRLLPLPAVGGHGGAARLEGDGRQVPCGEGFHVLVTAARIPG